MLTAVWVAVAAFVVGVGVAVYLMLEAARLMTQNSAAAARLAEREGLLLEAAGAAIDRAGEQLARTETITATIDEMTASVAELRGRVSALVPARRPGPPGAAPAHAVPRADTVTWTAALAYGVARALGLRWAALAGRRSGISR